MASKIPPGLLQYMREHPHQTYAPQLVISTAICCAAAIIAVSLRFVARSIARLPIGKDDIAIVVALALSLTYSIIMVSLVPYGFGKHVIYIQPADGPTIGKRALAALVILSVATYSIKVSVLLLYARIFSSDRFRRILWGVGAVCTAFFIASFFGTLFECVPVGAQLGGKPHTCINIDAEFVALAFINSFLDFSILCLPLPSIWHLHMSTTRKTQTTAIFCLGLLACVSSLIRAVYTLRNSAIDTTYADARTAVWVAVEINVSVVSACLPNLAPLVRSRRWRGHRAAGDHGSPRYDEPSSNASKARMLKTHRQPSSVVNSDHSTESGMLELQASVQHALEDHSKPVQSQRTVVMQVKGPTSQVGAAHDEH